MPDGHPHHDRSRDAGPYQVSSTCSDAGAWGISGPGDGLGYYAATLFPENTFGSLEEAEKAARLMNTAFREGERSRSRQITALLQG